MKSRYVIQNTHAHTHARTKNHTNQELHHIETLFVPFDHVSQMCVASWCIKKSSNLDPCTRIHTHAHNRNTSSKLSSTATDGRTQIQHK